MENTNEVLETTATVEEAGVEDSKQYSEKEIQSLIDSKVTQALKTARNKFEKEKTEAERLASMTTEEKFQEELKSRESQLQEREKQISLLENKNEASKQLADLGLASNLADLIVSDSAEEMNNKIKMLDKAFKESVQREVEKRIGGTTPTAATVKGMTKQEFMSLPLAEQQKAFAANPNIYETLN